MEFTPHDQLSSNKPFWDGELQIQTFIYLLWCYWKLKYIYEVQVHKFAGPSGAKRNKCINDSCNTALIRIKVIWILHWLAMSYKETDS